MFYFGFTKFNGINPWNLFSLLSLSKKDIHFFEKIRM